MVVFCVTRYFEPASCAHMALYKNVYYLGLKNLSFLIFEENFRLGFF